MPEQPACTVKRVSPPNTAAHGKSDRFEYFQGLHPPILIAELHGRPHSAAPTAPMRWGRLGLQRRSFADCWGAGCQESGHEARLHLVKANSSVNDCRAVATSGQRLMFEMPDSVYGWNAVTYGTATLQNAQFANGLHYCTMATSINGTTEIASSQLPFVLTSCITSFRT